MHPRAQFPLQVLLLTAALCLGVARTGHALQDQVFSGSITASFQSPVTSGNVINPGNVTNPTTFFDNKATAVCSVAPCIVSNAVPNTFTWGANPESSSFVFTPTPFADKHGGDIFEFGTLAYHNGTSDLSTLVFGVTLHLTFPGGPNVSDSISTLGISTTNNTGATSATNADSVTFVFGGTDLSPLLFGVFEGKTATVTLKGSIINDPQLVLTSVTLPPGDPNGFLVPAPEPGSLILLGLGLGAIALTRRFRSVKR